MRKRYRWSAAATVCRVVALGWTATVRGESAQMRAEHRWLQSRESASGGPAPDTNVAPLPAALTAKALLDANSPKPWHVKWNKRTGLPRGIWGETTKKYTGTLEEIARQLLAEYRPLFIGLAPGVDDGQIAFKLKGVSARDPKRRGVHFQELYKQIPVYETGPTVHIDADGHVIWAGGSPYPIPSLDVTPALSPAQAVTALRAALAPDTMMLRSGPENAAEAREVFRLGYVPDSMRVPWEQTLVIYPISTPPRLAYIVQADVPTKGRDFGTYKFFVDANTGGLLQLEAPVIDYGPEPSPSKPSTPDSAGSESDQRKLHPAFDSVPIRHIPQAFWDSLKQNRPVPAVDSADARYDTTRPNPRPYRPDSVDLRRKSEHQPPRLRSSAARSPGATAWFYSANYIPDIDDDSDGYAARAIIEWDADTDDPSLDVKVAIYGRDVDNQVVLLRETPFYTVAGSQADLYWTDVWGPYRSLWDFRLVLIDRQDDTLGVLEYGDIPQGGGIPEDRLMERRQEDAVFVNTTFDPPDHVGWSDDDNDGYFDDLWLLFKVRVTYDSTYTITAAVFAKDSNNLVTFIGDSPPFDVTYNNNDVLVYAIDPFPGAHSTRDFRVELYAVSCPDQCLFFSVPYERLPGANRP